MDDMTLAEQTGRRLLLAGLADDPALTVVRDWNRTVLAREVN
jgi:hypothetical protein